jgi:hypothetical protein
MTWSSELDPLLPASDGPAGQGDDELRLIKGVVTVTWPELEEEITMGTAGAPPTSADVTAIWDTLSSLAGGVAGVFAPGMIMMWSTLANGSIPADWTVCNGTNVNNVEVPDLTDLMIVGAGNLYPDGESAGGTGGGMTGPAGQHSHTVPNPTIAMENLPSTLGQNINIATSTGQEGLHHDSTISYAAGDPGADPGSARAGGVTVNLANSIAVPIDPTSTEADHTHTVTNVLPPYYALTYIMYVGPTP